MAHLAHTILAAALIAGGATADHLFSTTGGTSARAVATAGAQQPANATSVASIDSATERAFAKASRSVVYVENVGVGSGSGVIYDASGDIVTNAHVIENAQQLRVTLSTGRTYSARLVGRDVADDLAVLHINARGLPAAHFAGASTFRVARTVLAIGSPLGLQQSVTSGLISALNRTVQEGTGAYLPDAIQTSAPINPGNSGGALVTLDGSVVGIPTLEASDPQNNNGGAAQGIGFAVPSTRVTVIAHQIITTGKVQHTGRAYLGVTAVDATAAQQSNPFFGGSGTAAPLTGALVQSVGAGSPAERAGVQQGDVIVAVNGTPVSGESDLLVALAHARPGSTMHLTISRNGSRSSASAALGELAAA